MSFSKKPKTIDPIDLDPSIYYYDEVYDDMKADEKPSTSKCDISKSRESKYMKGLIETAERRKTDKEIRKFKKYTRDKTEAESRGELDDTDVYITSSYKSRLDEIRKLEQEQKQRSLDEKDGLMNFAKKARREEPLKVSETEKLVDKDDDSPNQVDDYHKDTDVKESDPTIIKKRPLKTIEDRREFLREALAKRTVGPVFEAALQRYKERKRTYRSR